MDPNATLTNLRNVLASYDNDGWLDNDETAELVDTVRALDEWLTKGGFLPNDWNNTKS